MQQFVLIDARQESNVKKIEISDRYREYFLQFHEELSYTKEMTDEILNFFDNRNHLINQLQEINQSIEDYRKSLNRLENLLSDKVK